jgi:F0F1-type ATP synthase assembly protein I
MRNWGKIRIKGKRHFVITRALGLLIGFLLGFLILKITNDAPLIGIIGIFIGWGLGSYFWLPYKWEKEEEKFNNNKNID